MHGYREELDRYQRLADQATSHFNVISVHLMLTDGRAVSTYRPPDSILLNVRAGFEQSMPLLAHELGHHILGFHGIGGSGHEMDANAKAVEVVRVWGYSEEAAFVMVAEWLCRRQTRGASASMPGHLGAAEELQNLKQRFNMPAFRCRPSR